MLGPQPPLTHGSPSHVRYAVFAFICSLSLLTYLDRVCIMRVMEKIQPELRLEDWQVGMVFSAFLLGYALFEIPGGWMGDAWGARRVIVRIVVWWSMFTALTGLVPGSGPDGSPELFGFAVPWWLDGFVLLVLVRFLFGCGEAGAYPNVARIVGAWFPYRERALAQGGVWMSARLGGAIAPVVIGALTIWYGWREAFWILGVLGVAWSIVFWLWFRDTPEQSQTCNEAERALIRAGPHSFKPGEAAAGHTNPPWSRILLSSNVWALCIAGAGVSFGWYFYPTWQPKFLEDRFQISFKDSEILTGLPFLCGAMGSLLGGGVSDRLVALLGSRRWGRSLLGLVGFGVAGTCVLATGLVSQPWQAVALLCFAFFINDIAIPVIWATSTDIGGRYAGTVAGVMNTAGAVGAVISPALTPVLRNYLSWPGVFAVLAAGWFIAALAWLRIDASEPLEPAGQAEPMPPGGDPAVEGPFRPAEDRIQAREDRLQGGGSLPGVEKKPSTPPKDESET